MGLHIFNFTQLFSKAKKRGSRRALTRIRANIRTNLILPETRSLPKIYAADSMCLSLLVFTQLFFENCTVEASQTGAWKQGEISIHGHSRSKIKVMLFGITEKQTTDFVSLYNNVGLMSKVSEEIPSENVETCRCRRPHCRLTLYP